MPFVAWFWLSLVFFVNYDANILILRVFNFGGTFGAGHWFIWLMFAALATRYGYNNIVQGGVVIGLLAAIHEITWYVFYYLVYPYESSLAFVFYLPFIFLCCAFVVAYIVLSRNGSMITLPKNTLVTVVAVTVVFDALWALAGFPVTIDLVTGGTSLYGSLIVNMVENMSWIVPCLIVLLAPHSNMLIKNKRKGAAKLPQTKKVVMGVLVAVLMLSAAFGGILYQQQADQQLAQNAAIAQMDHDQKLIYQATIAAQTQPVVHQANATSTNGTAYQATVQDWKAEFFVYIFYATYAHGTEVNQTLISQGFTADCISKCVSGINYFKDPTTLITSQGRGVEQCSIFHGTGVTDTCTSTNVATYEGWSTKLQAGQTVNATDTWAGTHQSCSTGGGGTYLIVDANGLRDVAATVTAGANGATVSTTLTKAFSITGTYTNTQVACLLSGTGTNADSGTNPLIYAEATFGPDTFHTGDSLTGVWIISRS